MTTPVFRSLAPDVSTTAPVLSRRRTRAQARLETNERRERFKRTREAMESMAAARSASGVSTPTKKAVVIGASFGENLKVENTPVKNDVQSPPQIRRMMAPQVPVPSPEKNVASAGDVKTRRHPVRGIAQSGSSASTRKRMISFSPERAERPVNKEAELQKLQRNLKVTEKLQQRLEGIPVKTPEKASPNATPSAPKRATPLSRMIKTPSPAPPTVSKETPSQPTKASAQSVNATLSPSETGQSSCRKELTFAVEEAEERQDEAMPCDVDIPLSQGTVCWSQLSECSPVPDNEASAEVSAEASAESFIPTCELDMNEQFTSTSLIEDVGLFNCETDVEFTGGVYGEGTDGKVSAAMVRGQKIALKRAKPHDGFPEEDAKRRAAVELHYLRKVRHISGFLQCLGICDGIEHTCIALEVMDCKLSDYLRRYGTNTGKSKRRFTLSLESSKAMLKQICQPMMFLHEQVNVAHGDLACRNILLRMPPTGYETKWDPLAKLSDFGRVKTPASEPPLFEEGFSFYKNCDVGSFAREILFRLLVGEIVPTNCTETRNLHKHLQDVVVIRVPEAAKERLGPFYRLFMRCAGWGVRPTFREIYEHLDDLEYFETSENGLFPLKPAGSSISPATSDPNFMSPVLSKMPSSGSKGNKYETPTTANPRAPTGPRMLPSKTHTEASNVQHPVMPPSKPGVPKTVNWLKARSVMSQQPTGNGMPTGANGTPNGRPAMPKKTPPSAGASRRSLQILNQIQHRLNQEKKNMKA
ncbi:hypothetical protein Poli38472_009573 [Pythium oligandrum]|uniref:Protein kinase domain-containing protein n=1 Tax=Pythium oligandrum TaxID=41045 RepID=A0A8K1CF59_PYTOL|nr:hypothetical protein Poli38472_009573 [Pythium oligandrum]|eukprot:TMW62080.1 hypothetical protein Poli38472_009573 [Pythium oligandrum]